ncbi:MAG: hypothetical protein ACYC4U_32750 [Pirellulaceae bacterium]
MKIFYMFVIVVAFSAGCSTPHSSVSFRLASERPEYELSYFPVADDGGLIRIPIAFKKTADAAGYHQAKIDLRYPENLATPWRTGGLSEYDRVGIVILERDDQNRPILESAKIFWFDQALLDRDRSKSEVTIPDVESLPAFDVGSIAESD